MRKSWLQVPTEAKIPSCSLGEEHACCHEPSFCANTSPQTRPDPNPAALRSWVFKYVMWAPWRLRSQSQVPVWRVPSTPEDYCYLVRHVINQPWQLSWIKPFISTPREESVWLREQHCDVRDEFAVLLESWRRGRMWGGGIVKTDDMCFIPSLYHTHQLHPLSVVDIYLQPGYRSMLEM